MAGHTALDRSIGVRVPVPQYPLIIIVDFLYGLNDLRLDFYLLCHYYIRHIPH